ncbi:hypothetical protein C8R43DRAFT_1118391 [Mycena crocata]|nr:hypothetical protein C8R43DRAFT_1118391 [Mycena crocata]
MAFIVPYLLLSSRFSLCYSRLAHLIYSRLTFLLLSSRISRTPADLARSQAHRPNRTGAGGYLLREERVACCEVWVAHFELYSSTSGIVAATTASTTSARQTHGPLVDDVEDVHAAVDDDDEMIGGAYDVDGGEEVLEGDTSYSSEELSTRFSEDSLQYQSYVGSPRLTTHSSLARRTCRWFPFATFWWLEYGKQSTEYGSKAGMHKQQVKGVSIEILRAGAGVGIPKKGGTWCIYTRLAGANSFSDLFIIRLESGRIVVWHAPRPVQTPLVVRPGRPLLSAVVSGSLRLAFIPVPNSFLVSQRIPGNEY